MRGPLVRIQGFLAHKCLFNQQICVHSACSEPLLTWACDEQLLLNDYSVHSDGADFAPLPSDSDWSSPEGSRCASEAGSFFGSSIASLDLSRSQASHAASDSPAASLSRASSQSRVSSLSRQKLSERAASYSHTMMINTEVLGAARGAGTGYSSIPRAGDAKPAGLQPLPLLRPLRSTRSLSQLGSTSGEEEPEASLKLSNSARLKSRVPTSNCKVDL